MKKYHHIFFDLDHTLWDFEKNSAETLADLYRQYKLTGFNLFSESAFIEKFNHVNNHLWALYHRGKINKNEIRETRFKKIFLELGLTESQVPADFAEVYLLSCPQKTNIIPFAKDVLDYLQPKYELHIITNGFNDVQDTKLTSAKIKKYFKEVITSESIGYKKPQREIFEYALDVSNATVNTSIMIGDNLHTDIMGAKAVNMDQVFFNPNDLSHQEKVTYEINCLSELPNIL